MASSLHKHITDTQYFTDPQKYPSIQLLGFLFQLIQIPQKALYIHTKRDLCTQRNIPVKIAKPLMKIMELHSKCELSTFTMSITSFADQVHSSRQNAFSHDWKSLLQNLSKEHLGSKFFRDDYVLREVHISTIAFVSLTCLNTIQSRLKNNPHLFFLFETFDNTFTKIEQGAHLRDLGDIPGYAKKLVSLMEDESMQAHSQVALAMVAAYMAHIVRKIENNVSLNNLFPSELFQPKTCYSLMKECNALSRLTQIVDENDVLAVWHACKEGSSRGTSSVQEGSAPFSTTSMSEPKDKSITTPPLL